MTIQMHVVEIDRYNLFKHNRYIRFDLDDGKDFCYRSRVSYNAFFNNYKGKKRNRSGKYIYSSKHLEEFQIDLNVWTKMMKEHPSLPDIHSSIPVVNVKNIWEFYKLIGYDYKTKKWSV